MAKMRAGKQVNGRTEWDYWDSSKDKGKTMTLNRKRRAPPTRRRAKPVESDTSSERSSWKMGGFSLNQSPGGQGSTAGRTEEAEEKRSVNVDALAELMATNEGC